jgi:crossover junction endodeoxyribonuclease RuvC
MYSQDGITILGVDPGSIVTGYGLIRSAGQKDTLLESGIIEPAPKASLADKLKDIFDELLGIIQKKEPDHFAIEQAFYSKNARSALIMGHARGVAILAAAKSRLSIAEYSPKEVKSAVVGTGSASKLQVQFMVQKLLKLKEPPVPLDAADALAVALCHAQRIRRNHLVSA